MVLWLLVALTVAIVTDASLELRPVYHFTRTAGEMNDPNGLMAIDKGEGQQEYHLYFQSQDPGQSLGSVWGHAVSVSYTHLRAHETPEHLVCRLLLEKKKKSVQHYSEHQVQYNDKSKQY
eukprot:TRINITY_DN59159_c0_g1_i1.p2 TRINITY_DN59159_c0_g1~~TRINITY_DN59159_c0_g1_i1.p2  ORF type:complete len:120 (+),score=27.52 TRINITY_DN59159_c0_g1_i1:205-564(+)